MLQVYLKSELISHAVSSRNIPSPSSLLSHPVHRVIPMKTNIRGPKVRCLSLVPDPQEQSQWLSLALAVVLTAVPLSSAFSTLAKLFAPFQQLRILLRVTCKSHHPGQLKSKCITLHSHPNIVLSHQCQEVCRCRLIENSCLLFWLSGLAAGEETGCWRSGPDSQNCFPYTFSNLFSSSASTCIVLKFLDFK